METACPASFPPPDCTDPSDPSCQIPNSPLTNEQQVGNSSWGTLEQPYFPKWLPDADGNPYESAPWGDRTTKNSDATIRDDVPVTNVTRYYEFTVSRGIISADGVQRDVILVNNQFPGPAIEANWGDNIQITVFNNISYPVEGTAIHWHGFLQRDTNWMDGVPAVSQCPIAPFSNFTYNIPAQLYGSSWYHAHYSAQYTGGVVGPIIVYGPSQSDFDLDVGPVMLSDWYHVPYFDVVSDAVGTDMSEIPPISDSLLINGRGRFDCSQPTFDKDPDWLASHVSTDTEPICVDGADLARFKFVPGKTHKLRLVNIGANGIQKFSIDNHKLTVVAYDYVPVNPHTLDIVTLSVGQRADVLVTADQTHAQAFWMRTYAPGGESCGGSAQMEIQAAIFYDGADATTMPTTHRTTYDTLCADLPLDTTSPEYVITPTPLADALHMDLDITLVQNTTGNFEWRMNDQTFRANFNQPALYLAAAGNVSYPYDPQWNMYDVGAAPAVVVNVTNKTPFAHPYHLHGHNYYVLSIGGGGSGDGEGDDGTGAVVWDGDVVNPSNPMRRDIATIPANGYLALMFENDNPGVWPFHCHIAWHLSGGLAVNFITRAAEIPPIPAGMKEQTCDAWEFYSHNNVVDQIDAGS